MTPEPQAETIDEAIVTGFLYGIQSDRLPAEEVLHRVAGFRHTRGYKEATQAITQAMLDASPEKRPETSEFHTSDMIYISSTGIDLENNKGFNQAIDLFESAIKLIGGKK